MKKMGLVLVALVIFAGIAGCSHGDGNDFFDINGTWLLNYTLIGANCNWSYDASIQATFYQSGYAMNVATPYGTFPGTFNPETGTFGMSFIYPNGVQSGITGGMIDDVTLRANEHVVRGVCYADFAIYGELLYR